MERERKERVNQRASRPPAVSSFALVDARSKRQAADRRELDRVAPLAALALILVTLLTSAFFALDYLGRFPLAIGYGEGFEAYVLRVFLLFGFIPLLSATVALAFFRPAPRLVMGQGLTPALVLASPLAGFFAGWLVWSLTQLMTSFLPAASGWFAVPDLWQKGALYLGRSPLISLLVLAVSLLLPATGQELLFRGLIQPVYSGGGGPLIRLVLPALLAAGLGLELPGLAVFFLLALLAAWVRTASGSLFASSLATAGFALALLYARTLFAAISQAVFGMPLIDPFRVRLFTGSAVLVLLVLFLAPAALIGQAAVRREGRGISLIKGTGDRGVHPVNRVLALICLAALSVCLYFSY